MSGQGQGPADPPAWRPSRPRRASDLVGECLRRGMGRSRASLARLMVDWPGLAGPTLAAICWPEGLSFPARREEGVTVILGCPSAQAVVVDHLRGTLQERLNGWFGFAAVGQIRIRHRPAPPQGWRLPPAPLPVTLPAEAEAALQADLAAVEDPALRESLLKLGRSIAARSGRSGKR